MATVVIIHAAEDALPARALAEKLRAANLNPVIELPPGEELRAAIGKAPVTLALWSPRSSTQPELADEVNFAKSRSFVVHARMQNTPAPAGFGGDPSIDLTGWRGEDDFPAWRDLAKLVSERAGVPLPPPPPAGPAGFFTPGRPAEAGAAPAPRPAAQPRPQQRPSAAPQQPRAQAPRPARAPRAAAPSSAGDGEKKPFPLVPVIIAAVLVLGGVGGYFVWNGMQGSQSASAWEDVPRNDADALRAFIADGPGEHRDEAQQALAELEEQSFDAAQEADTIDGFEQFLNEFPDSDHAIAARGRIAELRSIVPTEDTTLEPLPGDTTTTVDPDLLPPSALGDPPGATAPAPDAGPGPAPLTPAPASPDPFAEDPAAPPN